MMGLEKLLRGLYGSDPQIDMDKQIARARVPKPITFDFEALRDGIRRNNVGTSYVKVEALMVRDGASVDIRPTGQRLSVSGPGGRDSQPARRTIKVTWVDEAARDQREK